MDFFLANQTRENIIRFFPTYHQLQDLVYQCYLLIACHALEANW